MCIRVPALVTIAFMFTSDLYAPLVAAKVNNLCAQKVCANLKSHDISAC